MSKISRGQQAGTFKAFPEFTKLTFENRQQYEAIVAAYPPVASFSFADLMTWWSPLDNCPVSVLNDNLVISYWLPGSERVSGLCLVGTNNIDASFCAIFDHLRERGDPVRLVHVPEFVLGRVEYPELFVCTEERDFAEYVYDIGKFYPLNHLLSHRRHRVRRFQSRVGKDRIVIKSLDLSDAANLRLLLKHDWADKGVNKIARLEDETTKGYAMLTWTPT